MENLSLALSINRRSCCTQEEEGTIFLLFSSFRDFPGIFIALARVANAFTRLAFWVIGIEACSYRYRFQVILR